MIPQESLKTVSKNFSMDIFSEKRPMTYTELYEKVSCRQYDAILCTYRDQIDSALVQAAGDRLKVVSTMSTGTDHIDRMGCQKHSVTVHNVPGVTTDAVADYGIALLLLGTRRLDQNLKRKQYQETWYYIWNLHGFSLSQMTIGIVGLGRIGAAITQRLKGFNSRILYYSPRRKLDIEQNYEVQFAPLEKLLLESDAVLACCGLNHQTRHLFSSDKFSKMKSSSIFINLARGGICNHDDLYQALSSGQISVALLDVTEPEPLPISHPLHELENCIILPHIATNVLDSRVAICDLALEGIYKELC